MAVAFAVLGAAHTINVYSSTLTPSAAHSWLLTAVATSGRCKCAHPYPYSLSVLFKYQVYE